MKASNFRIGNFIGITEQAKKDVFDTCHLDNPESLGEILFEIASISDDKLDLYVGSEEMEFGLDELEQVRITDNILNRLGFKNDDGDFVIESGRQGFIVAKAQGDDLILLYREDIGLNYNSLKFIEYVHELQNIFFVLTNDELQLVNEA
jgi:hypothetical protein